MVTGLRGGKCSGPKLVRESSFLWQSPCDSLIAATTLEEKDCSLLSAKRLEAVQLLIAAARLQG